jgi:hypothetical protein
MTERIPYTKTNRSEEETVERHESFGLVRIARNQCGGSKHRLFGSHLDSHSSTFTLTVERSARYHSELAYDRFHADHDAKTTEIVEIEMNSAQFVELMTSLNMGAGIPCTLRRVSGVRMENVPDEHRTEAQLIAENFSRDMKDVAASVKPLTTKIATLMGKASLGKSDRQEVLSLVGMIVRKFDDHAPFVMKQFIASTRSMITSGKAEVEAYANSVIYAAGLEHLRQEKTSSENEEQWVLTEKGKRHNKSIAKRGSEG